MTGCNRNACALLSRYLYIVLVCSAQIAYEMARRTEQHTQCNILHLMRGTTSRRADQARSSESRAQTQRDWGRTLEMIGTLPNF